MKKKQLYALMGALILTANMTYSQDWPQYFGPDRNGISKEKGLLRTWPQEGPGILWSINVGIGFGGPVIKDGKIYLLDRDDKKGDKMRCFDLGTGKELWKFEYDSPGTVQFPGSRSVPAIDGNLIFSCGPNGDFYCIDINTHKPVWHTNIWKEYGGGEIPKWAVTQCPLVYGDMVVVASQAPQAGVIAFEKLTGKVKWATPSLGAVGYVSPAIVKISTENHIVMITGSEGWGPNAKPSKVDGIDPQTGKVLWQYANWTCGIPIANAVDAGNGTMLITGGYRAGSAMIRVEKKADGSYNVTELFKTPDFGTHTQPPILYNGNFYGQYTTNERKDGLVCMGTDGKVRWKTGRNPIFDKGGMILADGLLLITDGRTKLYLVEPDGTAFKPVASAELLKEGGTGSGNDPVAANVGGSTQNWAPLALSGGKLLIRDQTRLICIKVTK